METFSTAVGVLKGEGVTSVPGGTPWQSHSTFQASDLLKSQMVSLQANENV